MRLVYMLNMLSTLNKDIIFIIIIIITALERSVMNYWGLTLVLRAQPHPQFLKWYKTFSWLFASKVYPLTRQ